MTRTWTVLIVDDDADYRALVRRYLHKAGHTVIEAGTGREGMRIAAQPGIDAILVDGLLPDTDGLRWLAELRAKGVRTPAVFASSFFKDIETHRTLTRDLQVAAALQKPVADLGAFVIDVERALSVAMGYGSTEPRGAQKRIPAPAPPLARGSRHDPPASNASPLLARDPAAPPPARSASPPSRSDEISEAIDEVLHHKPGK